MLFSRHGESYLNIGDEAILGGPEHNPALTPTGIWQEQVLGDYMRCNNLEPAVIVHSPTDRTDHSAHLIAEQLAGDPMFLVMDCLREAYWGEWEGMLKKDVFTPEFEALAAAGGLHFKPNPTAESIYEVGSRVLAATEDVHELTGLSGTELLIVTHNLSIKSMVGVALEMTRQQVVDYKVPNGALLDFDPFDPGLPDFRFISLADPMLADIVETLLPSDLL